MAFKFSPSSLSLLKECPRCFWLNYNAKIKRPDSIFPSLPGGMDRILKTHFDCFRDCGTLPPELACLKGDVKLFADKEKLEVWRSNFKGVSWKDDSGNVLRGAVDNLLEKNGKLIVLDYKTRGSDVKEDTAEHYRDQLDIYNFLLRKNGYQTEDYSYLLFYYPNKVNQTGEVLFHINLVKLEVNTKTPLKIFKKALETLQNPIPKPSENCGYCKWIEENNEIKKQKVLTN